MFTMFFSRSSFDSALSDFLGDRIFCCRCMMCCANESLVNARFDYAEISCQREQRPNLFGLCRVQPIFNEVNAANNALKVTSSAKVHYFSEKQSYLNEKSYLNTIICHFLFKVGSINYHRKQINYGLCFFPY